MIGVLLSSLGPTTTTTTTYYLPFTRTGEIFLWRREWREIAVVWFEKHASACVSLSLSHRLSFYRHRHSNISPKQKAAIAMLKMKRVEGERTVNPLFPPFLELTRIWREVKIRNPDLKILKGKAVKILRGRRFVENWANEVSWRKWREVPPRTSTTCPSTPTSMNIEHEP